MNTMNTCKYIATVCIQEMFNSGPFASRVMNVLPEVVPYCKSGHNMNLLVG